MDLERLFFPPFLDPERDLARLDAFFGDLERLRFADFFLGELLLLGDLLLDLDFVLDLRVGLGILVTISQQRSKSGSENLKVGDKM